MAILAVAALIAVVVVAIQLVLPRLVERKAEQRLTRRGGHARVHLKAFPATKLLRKQGDSLVVKASGLVARRGGNGGSGGGLQDLAGFEHVDIQVIGVQFGPLTISRLRLTRHGFGSSYEANVQAPVTGTPVPLDVRATVSSSGQATNVSGSVAGLPAGPLVEALTAALATRF